MDVASAVNVLGINALRATGLLLVALLLSLFLRRSAAVARHQLWAGVLAGLLLLPIAGALAPPLQLAWLSAPRPQLPPPGLQVPAPPPAPWLPPLGVPVAPPAAQLAVSGQLPYVEKAPLVQAHRDWIPLALGSLWLLGTAVVLVRSGRRRWQAARLVDHTAPADPGIWPAAPDIEVREGAAIELPMTVGAFRPVILVPATEGRAWPPAWRAAVIEHEAAHVRRRDPLWQLLAELACGLYWFHPLVWLAARQLRTERELAADDEVLAGSARPSEYAELLITLGSLPVVPAPSGAVLPLLTPAGLKARLLGIVDERRRRTISLPGRILLALVGGLLFVPTASAVLLPRATSGLSTGAVLACARDERTGQPVPGAEVDVWEGMELAQRVTTDRRGCFRWLREEPHTRDLVAYVRRGPLAGRKALWPVRYGTALPATIDVRPAQSVSGTIRDEQGRPLPGALVRVVWSQSWARGPGPDAFVLADSNGRYRFEGLLYGSHRFYFEGPAGGVHTRLVQVEDHDVLGLDGRIPKAPPVTGYLVTGTRQPVVGARVEDVGYFPAETGRRLRGRHVDWDVSDRDGTFRMAFIGRSLRATGRDGSGRLLSAVFADWERPPSRIHAGATDSGPPAPAGPIVMNPAGVIRGVVRLPDGVPAAGAFIQAMVRDPGRFAVRGDLSVRVSADDQGRFVAGPVPLGPVEVRAMIGPRSEPPYRVRSVQRSVFVNGEADSPVELVLEWQPDPPP